MASPDQFFASGYPIASAAAGLRVLADAASRTPRIEPAAMLAFVDAVSRTPFAGISAPSPMGEPVERQPVDRHVSVLPPGGLPMGAPTVSWWRRLRPSAVTDRTLYRAAAWAGLGGFLLALLHEFGAL